MDHLGFLNSPCILDGSIPIPDSSTVPRRLAFITQIIKFLNLVSVDTKSLKVINYSGLCTNMAIDLNWIISLSVSGIVAIVGILFIVNILTRRSGPKDRKTNGWVG